MTIKGKLLALALTGFTLLATGVVSAQRHHTDTNSHTTVKTQEETPRENTKVLTEQQNTEGQDTARSAQPVAGPAAQSAPAESPRKHFPSRMMHLWPTVARDEGGTLLFSDSPEYVTEDGILYQDVVQGDARVLYYHLNQQDTDKKVAVVLESIADGFTAVRVTRGGYGLPNDDYLAVGKASQIMYYGQPATGHLYMAKNSKRLLDNTMNEMVLTPGQLIAGVYDFYTDKPLRVSVIMYPADEDPFLFMQHAGVQPKDEMRLRGTFTQMDRVLTSEKAYDPRTDGIVYFPLADNIYDKYRTGKDSTDGSQTTNFGNYGINYRIRIPVAPGSGKVHYYLCPLGGVYAGAVTVSLHGGRRDMLQTPFGRTFFGDQTPPEPDNVQKAREAGVCILTKTAELADLGTYDADDDVEFEFSPPGASNLPVNIIMMPE